MSRNIDNTQNTMDSRDIIERLDELQAEIEDLSDPGSKTEGTALELAELQEEYKKLKAFADECEQYASDWKDGEQVIRDSYFVQFTEQLIDDCYPMPKEAKSGDWPWRHMDYEAAAEELKHDYASVDFDGVEYWVRSS